MLASFETAHVGAVIAEHVRERLLRQSARVAMNAEVAAHRPLKVAFHDLARSRARVAG